MSRKLRLGYFVHSLRSDWNNGNAHFLRGLLNAVQEMGTDVTVFEPRSEWSIDHLLQESSGNAAILHFHRTYPNLQIALYEKEKISESVFWRGVLRDFDIVILHEWNPPALAATLLEIRSEVGFRLLFHDTHHRASSSPGQIRSFGTDRFDGVLAFGESLRAIYRERFGIDRVWTLHEAADTSVFHPLQQCEKIADAVWIGNWGDDERSSEIREFLLAPASKLGDYRFVIYGVRYPDEGIRALHDAGVRYAGYLPNLCAPTVYASARLTVHIPRQQYTAAMNGIPTIRVFEALACGIPLISAPWQDSENLFRKGDFLFAHNRHEMAAAMEHLLCNSAAAEEQALRGLATVLSRHTCRHRAEQLLNICEEVLR